MSRVHQVVLTAALVAAASIVGIVTVAGGSSTTNATAPTTAVTCKGNESATATFTLTCTPKTATTTTTTVPPTTTTTTTPTGGGNCTAPVWTSSSSQQSWNTDQPAQTWWVNNDAWSGSHGPQTISECNHSSWFSTSNQTNNQGQIETYPDTEYDVGGRSTTGPGVNSTTPISGYSAITSTFDESFPTTGWAGDAAYDLWTNNWGSETMVWNDTRGTQTYWSNCAESGSNPCGLPQAPVAVTLGGVAYHFFSYGAPGSNDERVFVRDTPATSGTVDILALYQWEAANGWAKASDVPTQLEYGVELAATAGTQTFPVNGLTFSLS
jgi:hypothetical protein